MRRAVPSLVKLGAAASIFSGALVGSAAMCSRWVISCGTWLWGLLGVRALCGACSSCLLFSTCGPCVGFFLCLSALLCEWCRQDSEASSLRRCLGWVHCFFLPPPNLSFPHSLIAQRAMVTFCSVCLLPFCWQALSVHGKLGEKGPTSATALRAAGQHPWRS